MVGISTGARSILRIDTLHFELSVPFNKVYFDSLHLIAIQSPTLLKEAAECGGGTGL